MHWDDSRLHEFVFAIHEALGDFIHLLVVIIALLGEKRFDAAT